jgi:hypothetical protein
MNGRRCWKKRKRILIQRIKNKAATRRMGEAIEKKSRFEQALRFGNCRAQSLLHAGILLTYILWRETYL